VGKSTFFDFYNCQNIFSEDFIACKTLSYILKLTKNYTFIKKGKRYSFFHYIGKYFSYYKYMFGSHVLNNYYEDLGIFLYLTPIISAFWATFALLSNKARTRSQIFLSFYLFMLGITISLSFWYNRYVSNNHEEIFNPVNTILTAFCTIVALLYFISLICPRKLTVAFALKYIIPISLYSTFLIIAEIIYRDFFHSSGWLEVMDNIFHPIVIIRLLSVLLLILFEIHVYFRIFKMYFEYREFIKEIYSYREEIDLSWILYFGITIALFSFFDLARIIHSKPTIIIAANVMAVIVIVRMYWVGSRQREIPVWEKINAGYEIDPDFLIQKRTQQQTTIEDSKTRLALLEYFEKEKPFLNPNLSMNDVAFALKTNRTYISQIINRECNKNFYTFVNEFRINYAISLIDNKKQETTIDDLLSESGFKSRSVFYKQFKEKTGYSPQDYITQKGSLNR